MSLEWGALRHMFLGFLISLKYDGFADWLLWKALALILQLVVLLHVHAHWIILLNREQRAMVVVNSRKLTYAFLLLLLMILTQLRNLCFQFCYSLPWLRFVGFYRTLVCNEAWLALCIFSSSFELIEWLIRVHLFRHSWRVYRVIQHTPKLVCPCFFIFHIRLILIL